jgi:hypothetical protein
MADAAEAKKKAAGTAARNEDGIELQSYLMHISS